MDQQETGNQGHLPTIQATGLLEPSTAGSTLTMLENLPTRLSNEQLAQAQAIAEASLPSLSPVDDRAFAECMRSMTILPRRADDDVTGEIRVRIYQKSLGFMPKAQWFWIVERAVERFRFFPSVKELLDLSKEWKRQDDAVEAQRLARRLAREERRQRHFDESRIAAPPITQEAVDAMPDAMVKIGLKVGSLIRDGDKVIPNPEPEAVA